MLPQAMNCILDARAFAFHPIHLSNILRFCGLDVMQDVFRLLIWVFGRLGQPASPTFEVCQGILLHTEQVC
jgi:hypothetical protein